MQTSVEHTGHIWRERGRRKPGSQEEPRHPARSHLPWNSHLRSILCPWDPSLPQLKRNANFCLFVVLSPPQVSFIFQQATQPLVKTISQQSYKQEEVLKLDNRKIVSSNGHSLRGTGAGVYMKKPQDCLGLLECMHANLQLQTKLAQQQMAILEDLQSSMTLLIPGGEGKDSLLPAIRPNLLLTCQPQISK
ncbi:TSSK6-activating co-chaperone protein isoform X10 [Macrotis lagotis]|uniref:TSSK6-activating co-chaperone protein isoform X10 n=1 Tax=Macrotis lagotis TaxID=92651 RepID=UPI003D693723